MKFSSILAASLFGLTLAAPSTELVKRQSSSTELENGACRRITLIFARGSTEPGNLVRVSRCRRAIVLISGRAQLLDQPCAVS